MGNITVAVIGALDYAGKLGKKGTSTDITLYNLKKDEDTVTFVEPTRYPERLAPLFYACTLATKAIVVVDEINAALGECLVMLQCSDIRDGYIIPRNYVPRESIEAVTKGTCLERFDIVADNPNALREKLLLEARRANQGPPAGQQAVGAVPVDHAFNVKGVGAVVLGIVAYGFVQKHTTLGVFPAGKTEQVRSIQKHDEEFDVAGEGDRVGMALKNVGMEDLERGTVLTNDPAMKTSAALKTQASLVKYWQTPIKAGMVMHVGHWTQFLAAKVDAVTDAGDPKRPTLTLALDRPLVHRPSDKAVLMYLDGAKLRVAGTLELP